MRSERQYLTDMVEAAEAITRFLTGIDREMFIGLVSCTTLRLDAPVIRIMFADPIPIDRISL
jgi:uncharacterized protein with HEPN domain